MNKNKEIKLSFSELEKTTKALECLQKGCTKEKLFDACELNGKLSSKSRKARLIIAKLASKHPIVSLSSKGNYRVAKKDGSDIADVVHQVKEHESRANKILERAKPLYKYIDDYMHKNGITSLVELERHITKRSN